MVYVEVFGGGGSVLLNKERSVREVLNDANGNLINLYRVVREHPDELKDRLLYVLHSREDFKIAQRRLAQFSYKDDILRAADFYQVVRQSYAGNGKQFSAVARSMWAGFPAIDRVAGRLQGVSHIIARKVTTDSFIGSSMTKKSQLPFGGAADYDNNQETEKAKTEKRGILTITVWRPTQTRTFRKLAFRSSVL